MSITNTKPEIMHSTANTESKKSDISKHWILAALLLGSLLGIAFRFYGKEMAVVGIDPMNFRFLGTVFVNLIRMIVGPLVFTSVFASIASIDDVRKTGKLFLMSISLFIFTTMIGSMLSIHMVKKFKIGENTNFNKEMILESNAGMQEISSNATQIKNIGDLVLMFIPKNLVEAFRTDSFLHIIFFAVVSAFVAISLGKKADHLLQGIESFGEVLIKLSIVFNQFAPFAVFGLTFWLCGTQDIALIKSLGKFIICVYCVAIFLIYVVYSVIMAAVGINPLHFFRKTKNIQFMSFILASSSAMIPLSMSIAENKLGVPKEKAKFVIPIGATMNMNGGAIYMSGYTIFVAQLFGIDLSFSQQALLVLLSAIGSIGTAPIPGSAIFLLTGVLLSLNLPVESIGLIIAVDRILDMMRTVANVTGDIMSSVVVSAIQGDLNREMYKRKM